MKNIYSFVFLTLLIIFLANTVFAQMDNLSNMSAEWMRSPARNSATDAADIVVYNPAALTNLKPGLHINFSNQTLFRNPSHQYDLGMGQGVKRFEQASSDPFLPDFYTAYRKDKWALFTGAFIAGGGAALDYPTGSITTDLISLQALSAAGGAYTTAKDQSFKATSMYLTTTIGGTYAANEGISFSLAARYISAKNTLKSFMTLSDSPVDMPEMPLNVEAEYSASGFGGVIGMNISAVKNFDFSVRYESKVKLDFKTKQIKDDLGLTTDGAMNRRDLPAVLALGASYYISPKLTASADYNYYFQENADWGKSSMITNEQPLSSLAGNASMYAISFQYQPVLRYVISLGGTCTHYGFNDMAGYYTNPGTFEVMQADNYSINTGMAIKPSRKVTLNVGYMHVFYAKDQTIKALMAQPLEVNVTMNNSANVISIGADIAFGEKSKN